MSYYENEKAWFPPVKTSQWKKKKMYYIAKMFNKTYADLINDFAEYFQIDTFDMQGKHVTYDKAMKSGSSRLLDYYIDRRTLQKQEKQKWTRRRYGRFK